MLKVIVCDLDGTLYPADNGLMEETRRKVIWKLAMIRGIDFSDAKALYFDLPKKFANPFEGLKTCGMEPEVYKKVFLEVDVDKYIKKDEKLVNIFQMLCY